MADEDPFVPSLPVGDNTDRITEPDGEVLTPRQRSLKNLRPPFVAGQVANPKGRPKKKHFEIALHEFSAKRAPDSLLVNLPADLQALVGKRPTMAKLAMFRLWMMAMKGDFQVLKWLVERAEGKNPIVINEGDQGALDNLIAALLIAPAAPGEVNDDADDGPVL